MRRTHSRLSVASTRARLRRTAPALALLFPLLASPGCYLAHAAQGQLRLLRARQPIGRVIADPATSEEVRASLRLVLEARDFARTLGLEVGGQYTSYAPWPGDRVVTVVVATRPGEIEPAGFRFPLLGRVPYKGFFDPERADAEAARLRGERHDVCVSPVPAYSTLGWLDDPVTGPMLRADASALVETVIHELVHATVFARDDADFNEGLATFVGQEGALRFFETREGTASVRAQATRARIADERRIAALQLELREAIAGLYRSEPAGPEREAKRRALEADARAALGALPLTTRRPEALASRLRLNDACLALAGAYTRDLPLYALKLQALGGDLEALVRAAREASRAPSPGAALLAR